MDFDCNANIRILSYQLTELKILYDNLYRDMGELIDSVEILSKDYAVRKFGERAQDIDDTLKGEY